MSDQKDQAPNSPSKESTGLLVKKRDFEETTSSINDFVFPKNKKMKLDQLQKRAYYDVLHAFSAASSAISSTRFSIIQDLKKEWNITHKTHTAFENLLEIDPLVQKLRKIPLASDEKDKQRDTAKVPGVEDSPLKFRMEVNKEDLLSFQERLNIAPAKMHKVKAKPSFTSDESPIPGWGHVSPASLVDRWVNIRMPDEEDYVTYLIKDYDEKTEMHHLMTALSKKDFVDPCDWIDLRHIPAEDIIWQEGHPGFPTRTCFLRPGETILHATSTAREKKKLHEIGKTASGIPIIRKLDKGKSIA